MSLLEVTGLNSYYGDSHILFDVSLRVEKNEVVALLGRNGAGKSTTLKSLMGVVTPRAGSVGFDGAEIAGRKSHAIARAGMQLVHEERRVFGSLNVEENLVLASLTAPKKWTVDRIYEMFPRLKERRGSRGTDLSGGEQQMLAIARALIRDPKIILLDEPFEGLAPVIVQALMAACRDLAAAGQTIVLVEQNLAATLALAQRVYIINNGHIAHEGPADELKARPELLQRYLGVCTSERAAALVRGDGINAAEERRAHVALGGHHLFRARDRFRGRLARNDHHAVAVAEQIVASRNSDLADRDGLAETIGDPALDDVRGCQERAEHREALREHELRVARAAV